MSSISSVEAESRKSSVLSPVSGLVVPEGFSDRVDCKPALPSQILKPVNPYAQAPVASLAIPQAQNDSK